VVEETDELAVIVPAATVGATFTTTTISTAEPAPKLGFVQVTEAVTVHAQPPELPPKQCGIGRNRFRKRDRRSRSGPLFVTVCVYVMLFPANTVGVAAVLNARSA